MIAGPAKSLQGSGTAGDVTLPEIPRLRFPAFEGAWIQKKLGDFFTFKNGVNADKSMYGRGRKFINVMDVISAQPIIHENIIGFVEISDKEFAKNEVIFGDILFQRSSETRAEVGQSNIYLDATPATFGGFVIRGRPKVELESRFFNALLKTERVRKDMTSRSGGSTRYNIGQESLEAVALSVAPTSKEQRKIADFLQAVDRRISLLAKRRGQLASYKAAIMQRIFAQTLRFRKPDGTGFPDWKDVRLDEVFTERVSRGNLEGELLSVTLRNGVRPISEGSRVDNSSDDKSNYKLVKRGDIAYNSMRMWQGASGVSSFDGIVSPAYTVILTNEMNDISFWGHYFKFPEMIHKFRRYSQGLTSDTWNLKFHALSSIKTTAPTFDEQVLIAQFLTGLDAKTAAADRRLDLWRRFRSALIQKMFV